MQLKERRSSALQWSGSSPRPREPGNRRPYTVQLITAALSQERSRVPQGFASTGTAYFVMNIASTIQSASLNRHPDPVHDLNPSTAASSKQPISPTISVSSGDNSIPYSTLKPIPRRSNLPPLPDLRFEQSYLASLRNVEGWTGVLWVTGRDQVCSQNKNISGARFIRYEK